MTSARVLQVGRSLEGMRQDGVTMMLCGFGLYSILAYAIVARRRELGIRLALGAAPRRIVTNVLSQAAWTLFPGLGLGLLLAWGGTRGPQVSCSRYRPTTRPHSRPPLPE